MECRDKVVHWDRVDLDYTFTNLVFAREGGWRRLPWEKARYRSSTADAASDR
jgi:hypothetical protein